MKVLTAPDGVKVICPFYLLERHWPGVVIARHQADILESMVYNYETVVVAGNQLGKDYIAGFAVVWWFISSVKLGTPCRVITTSVDGDHLRVLWGEAERFIDTCTYPLRYGKGGPLIVNHMEIKSAVESARYRGQTPPKVPMSYVLGRVSATGEGLGGHHSPLGLAVIDEASGVADKSYENMQGWAKRFLIFGNPWPCHNFFRRMVKGGSVLAGQVGEGVGANGASPTSLRVGGSRAF